MKAILISVSQAMTATPTLKSSGISSSDWSIHALRDDPACPCPPSNGSEAEVSCGVAPYDLVGCLTSLEGISL